MSNKAKDLHSKPNENIQTKTRNTGGNAAIWEYQKH